MSAGSRASLWRFGSRQRVWCQMGEPPIGAVLVAARPSGGSDILCRRAAILALARAKELLWT